VDATEDAGTFTDAGLAPYAAVVFLITTGDVLDDGQQAAFERYVRAGHGWVGVHSAADTEYDWSWYGGLVGAYFRSHPAIQAATIDVVDPRTVSTRALPARWTRTDEWYNFQSDPRPAVHVLATLDESTYDGGDMGADHPIAWWHDYDGGRAWYTAGGHTNDAWSEPLFLAHVLGGIEYAIGMQPAPAAQAKIISLDARVRARRVTVTVRYTGCGGCTGTVRVGFLRASLAVGGGTARATTPRLPRGHARVVVVLSGDGVRLTAGRPVLVR
jgi:type 1 glutamine amidotransferase